jgi:imidazolonepropionase-like amidohydrolase
MRGRRAFIALAVSVLFTGSAAAQTTVLTHATLIDGTGAPPQRNVSIFIERGRIESIVQGPAVIATQGATFIDLSGKYVVPGIINGHGHVGPAPRDAQLRQYALYGVTTTTSMSADPDDIAAFKAKQKAGDLRGSRILTVKYRFTSAPMAGSEYTTPEAARGKVDEIVEKGADFIKVWIDAQGGRHPKLSPDYVAAVFERARMYGKLTMAHIVELADARMVVDAGVNILAHNVRDQEIPADFIAKLKARNVTVISTLAREEAMFVFGDSPGFTDNPFFQKGLTPERLALLKTRKREEQANDPAHAKLTRAFEIDKINLKKLADAGVRFGFGTDSGGEPNRYFIQGFFEHRQMELMVQAGLTPMQVIQAFSKNNSEALGISGDFGTLVPGKAADLLVLTKNPLDDITNMRALEAVYLGGKKFE